MGVDETNHRDVNHTFASMARDDANPFVAKHQKDAVEAAKYWQEVPGAVAEGRDHDFLGQPTSTPRMKGKASPSVGQGAAA